MSGPQTRGAVGSGQELYAKAKRLIPGGTQLLSKRPEMFLPELWPAYYARAAGDEVWDLDGRRYVDMSYSGIGACVLGYADSDVDEAVRGAVARGTMSTLNCPEEVELAELLIEIHPWAEMVRYARSGGEAMAMAVRIARAATGRDVVAFCGYHGWHDWYLATNLSDQAGLDGHLLPGLDPAGVPRGLAGTALPFRYNRIDELEAIVVEHGSDLAAIVMEPIRNRPPEAGFLERVQSLARKAGAVLVFDEITAGWRITGGGAHLVLGVEPDVAVFAKGMSNGYPMAAILGVRSVMEAAQSSFISSTYWTERIGPTAALATIRKFRDRKVERRLDEIGGRVQDGWREAGAAAGLTLHVDGIRPLGHFAFDGSVAQAARTLFVQLLLERGFLAAPAFYAMYAHRDEHVAKYLEAVREAFRVIGRAMEEDGVERMLQGPVAHSGFRRLV
jgi:glutamate-1-semialdehyde 2,1-aminomutase